jgi:hypothetical protein
LDQIESDFGGRARGGRISARACLKQIIADLCGVGHRQDTLCRARVKHPFLRGCAVSGSNNSRKHSLECLRLAADCMQLAAEAHSFAVQTHFVRMARGMVQLGGSRTEREYSDRARILRLRTRTNGSYLAAARLRDGRPQRPVTKSLPRARCELSLEGMGACDCFMSACAVDMCWQSSAFLHPASRFCIALNRG